MLAAHEGSEAPTRVGWPLHKLNIGKPPLARRTVPTVGG
jgi:hypothetical protein